MLSSRSQVVIAADGLSMTSSWTRQTEKMRWKYLYKTAPHPPNPLPPCPTVRDPCHQSSHQKGNKQRHSSARSAPARLCNEAWHRRRTETKQGSPAASAATGAWHCVFLITAKIGPGVPSHLLNTGAGGWLPQGSTHRSPCTYCQSKANDKDHSHNRDITNIRTMQQDKSEKTSMQLCKPNYKWALRAYLARLYQDTVSMPLKSVVVSGFRGFLHQCDELPLIWGVFNWIRLLRCNVYQCHNAKLHMI